MQERKSLDKLSSGVGAPKRAKETSRECVARLLSMTVKIVPEKVLSQTKSHSVEILVYVSMNDRQPLLHCQSDSVSTITLAIQRI